MKVLCVVYHVILFEYDRIAEIQHAPEEENLKTSIKNNPPFIPFMHAFRKFLRVPRASI